MRFMPPDTTRSQAVAGWVVWISLSLTLLWGAVLVKSNGSVPVAIQSLAISLLKGLSMLAPSLMSGWFLLALAVTPAALRLLREILPRTQRLEVGQFKVQLSPTDLAELAFAGEIHLPLAETMAIPHREMAGSEGPLQEEPPRDEAYQRCMAELPRLFRDLNAANMTAKGEALAQLEEGWQGEYVPELVASVTYLRSYARQNEVQLSGYLSITLLFRHLMLFFHGQQEHAAHLVQDLDLLDPEDRTGFLRRPLMLWVLLALCRQRRWDEVDQLGQWLPAGSWAQQAVRAYGSLARGDAAQAAAIAGAALSGSPPVSSFTTLLAITGAHALLSGGRPLEAIGPARWVLANPAPDDPGLAGPLRTSARQVLARAATQLNWVDPVYQLHEQHPDSRQDPLVLHALAILTGRAGQRVQARHLIRRAAALVDPANGELSRAIEETARWLD